MILVSKLVFLILLFNFYLYSKWLGWLPILILSLVCCLLLGKVILLLLLRFPFCKREFMCQNVFSTGSSTENSGNGGYLVI